MADQDYRFSTQSVSTSFDSRSSKPSSDSTSLSTQNPEFPPPLPDIFITDIPNDDFHQKIIELRELFPLSTISQLKEALLNCEGNLESTATYLIDRLPEGARRDVSILSPNESYPTSQDQASEPLVISQGFVKDEARGSSYGKKSLGMVEAISEGMENLETCPLKPQVSHINGVIPSFVISTRTKRSSETNYERLNPDEVDHLKREEETLDFKDMPSFTTTSSPLSFLHLVDEDEVAFESARNLRSSSQGSLSIIDLVHDEDGHVAPPLTQTFEEKVKQLQERFPKISVRVCQCILQAYDGDVIEACEALMKDGGNWSDDESLPRSGKKRCIGKAGFTSQVSFGLGSSLQFSGCAFLLFVTFSKDICRLSS
jgi:hypothetical protein